MYRLTLILLALFLTLSPRSLAQCAQAQWATLGSGVGAGSQFANTFAVAGVGSRFEVLTEPTSGAASVYASYDIGMEIRKIQAIGGSSAWASDGTSLWCFDRINAASNPLRLRSVFSPPAGIRDFILVGFTVYVWQGTTLSVINYTDTAAPFISATIQLPATPFQASFFNNRLYLLASGRTVQILDVTDPANPAFIRSLSLGGSSFVSYSAPSVISGGGTQVYFVFYQTGIIIGSNAIRSVGINADQLGGGSGSVPINGTTVQISGNFMLQTTNLQSINWANPLAPTFSTIFTDTTSRFRAAGFVTSSGVTRAFIPAGEGGMLAVNCNTGALQNRYQPQPGNAYETALLGNTGNLYIADGLDGLRSATIADAGPGSRSLAPNSGTANTSNLTQIATADNKVFVSNGTTASYYSTSVNPAMPTLINTYAPTSATIDDIAASASSGLVLRNVGGARQLDLLNIINSIPIVTDSQPVQVDFPNTIQRVRAFGNLALVVTALDCRLYSFSALTPTALTPRSVVAIGTKLRDAAISGNHLYLLDFDGPIHTFDITNLASPIFLRSAPGYVQQSGMAVSGDWIGTAGTGLTFINIADRTRPIALATAPLPNVCTNVAAFAGPSGPHFLVSAGFCGVRAFAAPTDWSPQIIDHPGHTSTCPGGTATFTVVASTPDTPTNPTSYQWFRNGTGGGLIPGATSPTLTLIDVSAADTAFTYSVVVTNSCDTAASNPATLALCRVDFNCSGTVSVQDIFDYLTAYFAESTAADFNGQAGLTVQDLFDFLAAYFAGCA